MYSTRIDNVVASFRLGQWFSPLRYGWLALHGINTEYHPRKFHSIRMRVRQQQSDGGANPAVATVSALIFRNGKVVICGAPSERCAMRAARTVLHRVRHSLQRGATVDHYQHQHRHPACRIVNYRVHNVVGSLAATHRIAIDRLHADIYLLGMHQAHFQRSLYDPALFPAVRLKFKLTPQIILSISIFQSGKLIVSGARKSQELQTCFDFIGPFISSYKK